MLRTFAGLGLDGRLSQQTVGAKKTFNRPEIAFRCPMRGMGEQIWYFVPRNELLGSHEQRLK
jgi:hypothetical protein